MLNFSNFLFFIGLQVVVHNPETGVFPCSPIGFINERVTSTWVIYNQINQSKYNVAYDFDDTIYIKNPGFSSTVGSINAEVKKEILRDFKSGRNIFIISNRGEKDRGEVSNILRYFFGVQYLNKIKIILLGGTGELKSKYIENNNIRFFYGDSDSDMRDAILGGATPVRVLRNKKSKDRSGANIGIFKELIMNCSQREY